MPRRIADPYAHCFGDAHPDNRHEWYVDDIQLDCVMTRRRPDNYVPFQSMFQPDGRYAYKPNGPKYPENGLGGFGTPRDASIMPSAAIYPRDTIVPLGLYYDKTRYANGNDGAGTGSGTGGNRGSGGYGSSNGNGYGAAAGGAGGAANNGNYGGGQRGGPGNLFGVDQRGDYGGGRRGNYGGGQRDGYGVGQRGGYGDSYERDQRGSYGGGQRDGYGGGHRRYR